VGIGGYAALGQSPTDHPRSDEALKEITALLDSVRAASFPQLTGVDISLHPMRSDYVYLESRFTFPSFFLARKVRYLILFNPDAIPRQVPPDGLRAIVAHELAHIDYFHRRRRIALVSLIRLLSASFAVRFERGADLKAIALGYGPGLESYRTWLYRNVPANKIEKKKRDYFSPEEIEAIQRAARQDPQIMGEFAACVPRGLAEIERRAQSPGAPCVR
jgi:hypothetical protein